MPSIQVKFTVTPGANVSDYWIRAGNIDVKLTNGVGTATLNSPGSYLLIWHFEGLAGATLAIDGVNGNNSVVTVKQSTIPDGESSGAGNKRFSV
jgi:hypothetical protein